MRSIAGAPGGTDPLEQAKNVAYMNREFSESARNLEELKTKADAVSTALKNTPEGAAALRKELQTDLDEINRRIAEAQNRQDGGTQFQQWREEMQKLPGIADQTAKESLAAELAFWTKKLALTQQGSATEREVSAEIFRIRQELAARSEELAKQSTEAQKRALEEWQRAYDEGIQDQLAKAKGDSDARIAILSGQAADMVRIYGQGTREAERAQKELDAALEQSRAQQEAAESELARGKSQLAQESLRQQIADLDAEVSEGRITADQKFAIMADLYARIHALRQQDLADEMAAAGKSVEAITRATLDKEREQQEYNNELAQLNRQREADEARTDQQIGRDFSEIVMAGLSGRRGAWREAWKKLGDSMVSDLVTAIGTGLARQLPTAISSLFSGPGGPLGGLLGGGLNLLGLGGVSSFLGLGTQAAGVATQAAGAGAQAASAGGEAAAAAALTTAGGTLEAGATTLATSAATLDTAGASLTEAAAALNSAAATLSAGGAAGGGGLLGDLGDLADILPFASGGRPAPGVPALIGEKGPELWVPDGAGTILPNGSWGPRSFGSTMSAAFSAIGGGGGDTTIHAPLTVNGGGRLSDRDVDHLLSAHGGRIVRHVVNELRNRGLKLARA
jgi:hypothetical protein